MHSPLSLLRSWFALLCLAPLAALAAGATETAAAPAAPRDALPTLFVCGDSTAARDALPVQGWGEQVGAFFDPTKIHVENRARGGRSARTFIEEGLWRAVRGQLRGGDIVLLQFGHNDSKNALSIARYDLAGTGAEVQTVTDPATGAKKQIHTFGYYLRQMVDEAKQAGATVVVLSSVPRAQWRDGRIVRGEEEHVRWAAEVARAADVPYVDANALIASVYEMSTRARIKALYFPQDNTHTNPAGAKVNAACIVALLARMNLPELDAVLKSDALETAEDAIKDVRTAAARVKLVPSLQHAFPAPDATNVCPDTPLRLTFNAPPTLAHTGKIHIVDPTTHQDVDTIDLGTPVAAKTIGGEPNYRYYPVIVSGNEVTVYPKAALAYGRRYQVTVDAGVFRDGGDAYAALDEAANWTFTTKAAAPAAGATHLTVAADGTGDFCTVQGAIDFVPDGNTTPTTIFIKRGTYTEIVFFTNKHALTFLGEDRAQTVIEYATNDRFNPTGGNPFGDAKPDPSQAKTGTRHIYHRGVFLAHRVSDLVLANLTIRNTTPQGGSQAEAIILNGTTSAHAILKDVDLYSYQDTLQINGQAYLSGCHIEGDIDFMWGTGPCFFENCTCRSLRSGAYYTQIRNPGTNHGYVYVGCTFDGAQGVMGNYLSRIGTGRFPHSEVVLLDCVLTDAVSPVAWQLLGGREGNASNPAEAHLWEYHSRDPQGRPVNTTFRLAGSRQLAADKDAAVIRQYHDPAFVLGGGWNPKAAPIFHAPAPPPTMTHGTPPTILVQPASQLALLGTSPSVSVVASASTGGRLSYQWFKDGHPMPGTSGPTLRIDRMQWTDAAVYTVVIGNTAGSVTSAPARLTAVAPQAAKAAPDLPRIPDATFDVTAFGAAADGATDNTLPIQKTIDAAVAAGGGVVVIPAGPQPYLCGPLKLGSGVNLEISAGATLQLLPYSATPKPGAYPLSGHQYPNFLTATKAHDVAITGAGTINGEGDAWWAAYRADRQMPHRPFLIRLTACERVLVSGLTLTRSPMFHFAASADHLTIVGLRIRSPENAPNTDGVDPAGSHHLIQNCDISVGDDNVVMKPGGTYCSDITVADCAFGEGHGLSVGGQSNRGLDGMVVKNCSFDGTVSALRLKADPTQGGAVKNITYTNLTMQRVQYPIVFYSYYNKVGNPAATSGSNQTTPEKVQAWNAQPPNRLDSTTLPTWSGISVTNAWATDTQGYSIIWGLPLERGLISDIRLANVHISGGPGFEIYNAANVQLAGGSHLGKITTANALVLEQQPVAKSVRAGGSATFTIAVAAPHPTGNPALTYAWSCDGKPLSDGTRPGASTVSGAQSATLQLTNITAANAGKYAVTVRTALDGYDVARQQLAPGSLAVSATSTAAMLTVGR